MRHDIKSCDQGGKDQDEAWLDGPVASVKGQVGGFRAMDSEAVKLEQNLTPMDRCNGEEQVRSRSMDQGHMMI
jgi:hypothetical protein